MTGTEVETEQVGSRTEPTPSGSGPTADGPRRRMPAGLAGVLGFLLGTALTAGLVAGAVFTLRDDFRDAIWRTLLDSVNPFSTGQVDRSETPVLVSIKDLARFVAAEAQYEVLVDLENDVRYVPSWLAGERLVLAVNGSVEAYVDFTGLDEDAIEISEDGTTVTVTVPEPELAEPRIDLEASRALTEDRGLVDRVGDLFESDTDARQEALATAQGRISDAAAGSDLDERARANTTATLEAMLSPLGYDQVVVEFG